MPSRALADVCALHAKQHMGRGQRKASQPGAAFMQLCQDAAEYQLTCHACMT